MTPARGQRSLALPFAIAIAAVVAGLFFARPRSLARADAELARLTTAVEAMEGRLESLQARPRATPWPRGAPPVAGAAATPPAATAPADDGVPANPREAAEARDRGRALITRAIEKGLWSEDDRREWRQILATADAEGSTQLMEALVSSINEGRLRVAPPPP